MKVSQCALASLAAAGMMLPSMSVGQPITVQNHSFEDTTGQTVFNEFTFGVPAGWMLYDPSNITGSAYIGTLLNPQDNFFSEPAPDGTRVAILYNALVLGAGEYGIQQSLSEVIEGDTTYTLEVEVGDIDSGTATDATPYNLEGFSGYRVELLADPVPASVGEEQVLASDANSLAIVEGTFETSTVVVSISAGDPRIGQALAVRLVHLNQVPVGVLPAPDHEVDFDNVRLTKGAVPVELDRFVVE